MGNKLHIHQYGPELELRLKGLTLKALKGTPTYHALTINDAGYFTLECQFRISRKSGQIEKDFLVSSLVDIKKRVGFDKIKFGHWFHEFTEDEIIVAVNEKINN